VIDSGIERNLEDTAYATRRSELEAAMQAIGAERSTTVELSDVEGLDGVPARRLRHVVTENERVRRFAAALESGDLAEGGKLLLSSHESLRDDYEVTVDELDVAADAAVAAGALGARMTGGGFGGSVVMLVARGAAREIGELAAARYRAEHNGTPAVLIP